MYFDYILEAISQVNWHVKYVETFGSKNCLQFHLLFHENKRQFKCQYEGCGKEFNTKESLSQHKLVHLKNKLLQCNYCSYQTNHSKDFNAHIQIKYTRQELVMCK